MSKHTPGPWHEKFGRGLEIHSESHLICKVWGSPKEWRANARLIAAAPMMYEYIASSASNGCAEAKKIIAAIAKAEGEKA